jgi:hypothetical protein
VEGAVHRLDAVMLPLYFGKVHILPVVVPVAGFLPEINLQYLGTYDHFISPLQMFFPFPILNNRPQHGSFGMKYDKTCSRFIAYLEEIKLPSQLPVIPLFCFLTIKTSNVYQYRNGVHYFY